MLLAREGKMLLISEVAAKVGLHPDTIRRLERRGLIAPRRDVNGWRRYSPDIVEQLRALYISGDNPEPTRAA